METIFLHKTLTDQQVLDAFGEFARQYPDTNTYDNWLEKGTYKYAVQYKGRKYPPKEILSMASDIPTTEFSGGKHTNRVFQQLGFEIVIK